ncbi:MAG: DNA alkylation repair protein [Clostridia bacterium]|nr:DNA alkylation repair protein [Clostridia bacterium]
MKYSEFIDELKTYAEEKYAAFHRGLTPTKYKILGIRVPILRKLAQKYKNCVDELFAFPNEYYETVFIKLTVVSFLPYAEFIKRIDACVALMDNWAHCDSFKGKYIRQNRNAFLPILENLFFHGGEFFERYVLVTLLFEYVEEEYLPLIESYIRRADVEKYYVHMAVAWLTAEILIKFYNQGVLLLQKGLLDRKTHNKAIQKAIESYRLTEEQKEHLCSMKIKTKR